MAYLSYSVDAKIIKVKKSKPKKQKVEYFEGQPKEKQSEKEYELIENYKEMLA